MSLRRSTRRTSLAFKQTQKKYKLESDSEDDSDEFGGVLATLKNDNNNARNQRRASTSGKGNLKKKVIHTPPRKQLSKHERDNAEVDVDVDENEKTPPMKSIIMTRSKLSAISPLTAQKPGQRGRKTEKEIDSEESSRADSFDSDLDEDDDDDETRHQTLSSAEEKTKSRSSISESEKSDDEEEEEEEEEPEDSYQDSESSSEFEFQGDDEEFVPEEEEYEDESAAMSEFIVDDVSASEDINHGNISIDTPAATNDGTDDGDDDNLRNDAVSTESGDSNTIASKEEEMAPDIEEDSCADIGNTSIDVDDAETQDLHSVNDNDEIVSPRKTLDFDSPEPQMAMIVDEDDDFDDDGDVLVATILGSDAADSDTIVLTFDEDEDVDEESNDANSNHETIRSTPQCVKNPQQNEKMNKQENSSDKDTSVPTQKTAKSQYRQEGEVKRGKWALGAKIGVGSFGQVHVGMNTQTGVLMAVKKFKMEDAIMRDIRTEVELMRSLKHTNIVRYLGAQMDNEFLHIFQEWVPGGSVSSLLSKFGSFSIEVIQSYISQTLRGLSYLHDNDIMHRDIKGSNILVNDEGVVKLADFGASKKLKNLAANMMMSLTVRGTPYFMAPEVFEEKYSAKADVWGIGCVAFQMVTASPPWKEMGFTNPISLFNHIKKNKGSPPMEHPQQESFSKRQQSTWGLLEEFVNRCFEQDPSERPSARELLDDPFVSSFSEGNFDDDESTQYRGLFSPGNESKNHLSPMPAKGLSPCKQTKQCKQRETTWISPSNPKKKTEKAESKTPPRPPTNQNSPLPDAREWPTWAKHHLEEQKYCTQDLSPETDASQEKLPELMDSLALSETGTHIGPQKLWTERRSSTTSASTIHSNLAGLRFLESTRSNPIKKVP